MSRPPNTARSGHVRGLRLLVYDRTCLARWPPVGLSAAWATGAFLYRRMGRLDAVYGASSWDDALRWLATVSPSRSIEEIQYWGHGRWGQVLIDEDVLDVGALAHGHRLERHLAAVRERLLPDGEALVWLRTCESFGASRGLDFAQRFADGLGARVAGHTFIIGAVQSGLRALLPGCRPTWSAAEGIKFGTPESPIAALPSGFSRPRTVTCLTGRVPTDWFSSTP